MAHHFRSAKAVIIDNAHHALVLRRSGTHPTAAYASDLPGGVIEPHESMETGIIREIYEETGLIVSVDALSLVYESSVLTPHTRVLYSVRIPQRPADITLSWEHDQFSWVPIHEVNDIERPFQQAIDSAMQQKFWDII